MKKTITAAAVSTLLLLAVVLVRYAYFSTEPDTVKRQTPQPPFPYHAEKFEITAGNGTDVIGGTLTVPHGRGPFPAAVLLSVAGPTDRDQSFYGHRGFQVLADRLTRSNIAVARFDDRGVGNSTGDYFATDWSTLAADALHVLTHVGADDRIDGEKTGFIGMSQGGAIGAIAASKDDRVAFLVLLSAPGLRGVDAIERQFEATLALIQIPADRAEGYRALFRQFIDIVTSDPDDALTRSRMEDFLDGAGRALVPPYEFLPKEVGALADVLLGPWYRSNILFDPDSTYQSLALPVLALGGSKDLVLPPADHLTSISQILESAPTADVTTMTVPGINHVFQDANTGMPQEYAELDSSFSERALAVITDWIDRVVRQRTE